MFSKPSLITPAISTLCTFRFLFRNLSKNNTSPNSLPHIIPDTFLGTHFLHTISQVSHVSAHFLFPFPQILRDCSM